MSESKFELHLYFRVYKGTFELERLSECVIANSSYNFDLCVIAKLSYDIYLSVRKQI